MIKLPPIFVALRKSIYQSAKTPEEAAKHRQWAEEDFSAKPRDEEPPKSQRSKRVANKPDIHTQAAYHLTHAYHHYRQLHHTGSMLGRRHREGYQLHQRAAENLMAQGAKPRRKHFEEISRHYARRVRWATGSPPQPAARLYAQHSPARLRHEDYHVGLSNAAYTLSRDPMYHG